MRHDILTTASLTIALLLTGTLGIDTEPLAPAEVVTSAEYAALDAAFEEVPGYLGLAPALDGSTVLHAAFEGDAPDAPTLPLPAGWSLQVHADQVVERLSYEVQDVVRLTPQEAMADGVPPLPEDAVGIGPGSPLLITIPNEGTFICTANFVFEDGNQYYLGAAGHCFLPPGETATHGSGAGYNANGVVVEVCVDFCYFGGLTTGFLGDFRELGTVAYARQTGDGGDIGNDFGVVEIPSGLLSEVRTEMPMWDGPTGADSNEGFGAPVVHYGNGIDAGTFMPSKGRAGTGLNDGDSKSWQANVVINGGDSGSAINHAGVALGADAVTGTDALGIVTHGIVTGGVPLGWGTTIGHAIGMATQANLQLTLLLEGQSPGSGSGGGGPAPAPSGLTATATKKGPNSVTELSWNEGGTYVDVLRDGQAVASGVANSGTYSDKIGKGATGTYTYQVCNAGTSDCSGTATVTH